MTAAPVSAEAKLARPPWKMAGGKTKLLPELLARLPRTFRTYHEPFFGGGALFWAIAGRCREGAILSDLSVPLARALAGVRDDVDGVVARLSRLRADQATYYRVRALGFDDPDDAEVAARFVYLNKAGFNGLMRFNRNGEMNTPWGQSPKRSVLDEPNLRACSAVLREVGAAVHARGFEEAMADAREGDLAYCDPPYDKVDADSFTAYQSGGFGRADQARLRDAARELKARGVRVVLSNADTPFVRGLYADGFTLDVVYAPRAINSKGGGRGPVRELIIT